MDDYDGIGEFGWNGMGDPAAAWHPAWGALAGSGIGTGTAIAVRQLADGVGWKKWAEAIGFGANALLGGAAMFYGPARAAGWTCLAAGFGNHVPRLLEDVFINYAEAATAAQGTGLASIKRVGRVVGVGQGGTGMAALEPTRQAGMAGQAGERARLLGAAGDRQQQLRLVGGPALSSIGTHFGNSIVGAQR